MVSFKVHFLFRDFSIYIYDFRHCILSVSFILNKCLKQSQKYLLASGNKKSKEEFHWQTKKLSYFLIRSLKPLEATLIIYERFQTISF